MLRRRFAPTAVALLLLATVPLSAQVRDPVLRVGLSQEPGSLNPIVGTQAVETDIANFVFSGLIRYDEHGNRIPDLAIRVPTRENGDIARDGKSITYHMVHNARWHDGVPVTAADVKFTFDAIMNPANNIPSLSPYDSIERVETPDPFTVRLVLKHPFAPALDAFNDANQGAIVPAHLLSRYPDLNHVEFAGAPVGSGPYKLVSWRHGSEIVLEANPDYFRGAPKIKHVVVRFLSDDNTMMVALRTGELDLGDGLNISTYQNLGNVPGLLPALTAKTYWEHLTFNTSRAPLDDVRVRRALCAGFDVHEIFAKVSHGLGLLGPTSENPATPWFNRRMDYYPFDPRAAGNLLDSAGWKLGADGFRARNGTRLSISLISTAGNITREQTEAILQQRWAALGIEVIVKNLPAATLFAPMASGGVFYGGNFDVALSAFIESVPDPSRTNMNSSDRIPPHGNNVSRYSNAELTGLEAAAAATYVTAERKRIYDHIQEIELRELPYYVIRWAELIDMRSARLSGVRPPIVNSTFWNVADWTLAH